MKRVVMVLTSAKELAGEPTGFTASEAADPWKVFRDAGIVVDFASIDGNAPAVDGRDDEDPTQAEFFADLTVERGLANPAKVDDVPVEEYDACYLVGGHGTMVDFRGNTGLQKLVREMWDQDGIVSAVCHGPSGLLDVELDNGLRLVEGRKVAAFSDAEEKAVGKDAQVPFLLQSTLEEQGAVMKPAADFEEQVEVDERLVTGQNPASAAGVAKEVVKLLAQVTRKEKAAEEQAAAELREAKDAEKAEKEQSEGN